MTRHLAHLASKRDSNVILSSLPRVVRVPPLELFLRDQPSPRLGQSSGDGTGLGLGGDLMHQSLPTVPVLAERIQLPRIMDVSQQVDPAPLPEAAVVVVSGIEVAL